MKFMVTRSSSGDRERPCPGAVWEQYTWVDRRVVDDPIKLTGDEKLNLKAWYDVGRNHRVVDGQITRDRTAYGWFIEIHTLSGLVSFMKGQGGDGIILNSGCYPYDGLAIEIYDTYRE